MLAVHVATAEFPIEVAVTWIMLIVTLVEFILRYSINIICIYSIIVTKRAVGVTTAQFFLRSAPLLDPKFMQTLPRRRTQMLSSREIEINSRPQEFYDYQ